MDPGPGPPRDPPGPPSDLGPRTPGTLQAGRNRLVRDLTRPRCWPGTHNPLFKQGGIMAVALVRLWKRILAVALVRLWKRILAVAQVRLWKRILAAVPALIYIYIYVHT